MQAQRCTAEPASSERTLWDPLAPVLAGLIGREVAVLACGRIHAGKLIQSEPITLLGPDGQVTVVVGPAVSVQF